MESENLRFAVYDKNEGDMELTVSYLSSFFDNKKMLFNVHRFYDTYGLIDAFRHISFTALLIGMNSMEEVDAAWVIKKLAEGCQLVIMSNSGDYSMEGYRLNAFDYWLKPLDEARVYKTLGRIPEVMN